MTRVASHQSAFSSGEISPLLRGRPDYQRFQTGLAKCRGWLPLRQGGVTRAPGTVFLGYTRNNLPARLIAFHFARDDALILEMTQFVMRVWRYGELVKTSSGAIYEMAHPYSEADLRTLHWVQSADVIYIAGGGKPIQRLARYALNNWTIGAAPFDGGPFRVQNLTESATIRASAATGAVTLTASSDTFVAGHVGALWQIEAAHYTDIPLWTGQTDMKVGTKVRYDGRIYQLVDPQNPSDASIPSYMVGDSVFWSFSATKTVNTGVNPPQHERGTEKVSVNPEVYWRYIGDGVGVCRITAVAGPRSATASVLKALPDSIVKDPSYRWSEGAWSAHRGYPAAIEIHEQRLAAASTPADPRTVWFSSVGGLLDFTPGTEADSAFAYSIGGGDTINRILWLKSGRAGLHVGALGDEISVRADAGKPFGPGSASISFDGSIGSKEFARPIGPDGHPIFISRDGRRLYEVLYDYQQDANRPLELSLPSEHLGAEGFEEVAWQGAPLRQAWLRTAQGNLCMMLYDPSEEVLGWARVPAAGGHVEALAVVPNATGTMDCLTLVIRREIGNQVVRMIELQAENWAVLSGAAPLHTANHLFAGSVFHDDNGVRDLAVPHLVGCTVGVWTSHGEFGPLIVPQDGHVALPVPVTDAIVGLVDDTAVAETLPLQPAAPDGSATARRKRLSNPCGINIHRTAAIKAAAVEYDMGLAERQHQPLNLIARPVAADLTAVYSGTLRAPIISGWCDEVALRFWPVGGAPATLTGVIPAIVEGGL